MTDQFRRYSFPTGELVIDTVTRQCAVIPGWCPMISTPIDRTAAAAALRQLRQIREHTS